MERYLIRDKKYKTIIYRKGGMPLSVMVKGWRLQSLVDKFEYKVEGKRLIFNLNWESGRDAMKALMTSINLREGKIIIYLP